MKKLIFACLMAGAVALVGCESYDDSELKSDMESAEDRLDALEDWQLSIEEQIAALQTITEALEANDYVTDVEPITVNGEVVGYDITFAQYGKVTIANGTDGEDGEDGEDGQNGTNGSNGTNGESMFDSVDVDTDNGLITLILSETGETYYIPMAVEMFLFETATGSTVGDNYYYTENGQVLSFTLSELPAGCVAVNAKVMATDGTAESTATRSGTDWEVATSIVDDEATVTVTVGADAVDSKESVLLKITAIASNGAESAVVITISLAGEATEVDSLAAITESIETQLADGDLAVVEYSTRLEDENVIEIPTVAAGETVMLTLESYLTTDAEVVTIQAADGATIDGEVWVTLTNYNAATDGSEDADNGILEINLPGTVVYVNAVIDTVNYLDEGTKSDITRATSYASKLVVRSGSDINKIHMYADGSVSVEGGTATDVDAIYFYGDATLDAGDDNVGKVESEGSLEIVSGSVTTLYVSSGTTVTVSGDAEVENLIVDSAATDVVINIAGAVENFDANSTSATVTLVDDGLIKSTTDFDNVDYSVESDDENDGSSAAKAYQISTAGQLLAISQGGYTLDNTYFELANDIDMDGIDFTTISYGTAITGLTFDGGEFTISNLSITSTDTHTEGLSDAFIGLFYCLDGGSVVKDLTISNPAISGAAEAGAIAGDLYNSTLDNCHVVGGSVKSSGSRVGGLVGTANDATITGCTNTGTEVEGTLSVGGLVGRSNGNGTGSITGVIGVTTNTGSVTATTGNYVGGIVGYYTGSVSKCTNSGTVTVSSNSENVGGIVGCYSSTAGSISDCNNYGVVLGSDGSNGYNTGGIVGYYYSETGSISGCNNYEAVTGYDSAGGIAGAVYYGDVDDCTNEGDVTGYQYVGGVVGCAKNQDDYGNPFAADAIKISNSYNSGDLEINKSGNNHMVGGIVGELTGADIELCGNTGTIGENSDIAQVGGIVGIIQSSTVTSNVVASYNTGDVYGRYIGGIAYNASSSNIVGCYNTGDLYARVHVYSGTNYYRAGGLLYNNGSTSYVTSCYSTGGVYKADTESTGTDWTNIGVYTGSYNDTYLKTCYVVEVEGDYTSAAVKGATSVSLEDLNGTHLTTMNAEMTDYEFVAGTTGDDSPTIVSTAVE